MSSSGSPDDPPSFEGAFHGDDVEQRIYGTVLQTREPAAASAIASVAGCDLKTAQKYLGWFSELGIVMRHDSRPATYERNDAYFEWRRVNQLVADHSVEDLQQHVRELSSRIGGYEDTYDTPTPTAADAVVAAQSSDGRTIDDVYGDLND